MTIFFTIEDINEKIRLRKKLGDRNTVYATYLSVEYAFQVTGNEVKTPEDAAKLNDKVLRTIIIKIKQHYTNAVLTEEERHGLA